jgi:hypothetical protein
MKYTKEQNKKWEITGKRKKSETNKETKQGKKSKIWKIKKGTVVPARGKKETRGVEVWLHSFLNSTPDGVELWPSRPSRFSPGKERRSSLNERLCGHHIPSGRCWTRKHNLLLRGERQKKGTNYQRHSE